MTPEPGKFGYRVNIQYTTPHLEKIRIVKQVDGGWCAQCWNYSRDTIYIDPNCWCDTKEEAVAAARQYLEKKYNHSMRQLDFMLREEI